MSRRKGQLSIDPQDIVGQCLGKFEVQKYFGATYSGTQGGNRLRHWYWCKRGTGTKLVQRGQVLRGK